MIYVTGDLHGDLSRLKDKSAKSLLKKGDILLCCGDFGFVWNAEKTEKKALRWLSKQKYTLLFVEGTHDNLELLNQYELVDYCGGKAHKIAENIYHLCRGQLFELEGQRVFAFGGGESCDSELRAPSNLWWPNELPTLEELEQATALLQQSGNHFDFAITHDCSTTVKGFIDMDSHDANHLNAFFDQMESLCSFKRWFFGCYHLDKAIPPYHRALFRDIVPLK